MKHRARVDIYWNLHKNCFSLRYRGKVIAHANYVWLEGAALVVNRRGREKVLREKRKNVHAFVRAMPDSIRLVDVVGGDHSWHCMALGEAGWYVKRIASPARLPEPGKVLVSYNPYRSGYFLAYRRDYAGQKVESSQCTVTYARDLALTSVLGKPLITADTAD